MVHLETKIQEIKKQKNELHKLVSPSQMRKNNEERLQKCEK